MIDFNLLNKKLSRLEVINFFKKLSMCPNKRIVTSSMSFAHLVVFSKI